MQALQVVKAVQFPVASLHSRFFRQVTSPKWRNWLHFTSGDHSPLWRTSTRDWAVWNWNISTLKFCFFSSQGRYGRGSPFLINEIKWLYQLFFLSQWLRHWAWNFQVERKLQACARKAFKFTEFHSVRIDVRSAEFWVPYCDFTLLVRWSVTLLHGGVKPRRNWFSRILLALFRCETFASSKKS